MNNAQLDFKVVQDNTVEILKATKEQAYVALAAVGEKMVEKATKNCPVNTGRLHDSITYVTQKAQSSPGSRAQSGDADKRGEPEECEVQVGTNVEYAKYVEYDDRKSHPSGRAHFLRDCLAGHSDEYKATIETALKD